jgi:hypothetical protein
VALLGMVRDRGGGTTAHTEHASGGRPSTACRNPR